MDTSYSYSGNPVVMLHASFLRGGAEIAKTECNMKSFTGVGASGSGATVWYGDAGSRCTLDVPQGGATSVRAVDVVYPPDGQKATPCTTEWLCEDDSSDRLLHGVERVTSGRDRCIDWCEFSADLENATVVFKCRDVNGSASLQPARH